MPSLTITTRKAKDGPRYVVRYRLGGRAYPIVHGGSFRKLKDAKRRRDLVAGELATGRNPADLLEAMRTAPAKRRTFREWAAAYETSRVDLAAQSKRAIGSHLRKLVKTFGDRDPATITPADVQEWIGGLQLKPVSIRTYLMSLRSVLDFADVTPNPARDRRVRLPREEQRIVEPPSSQDVETIIARTLERWRLPLRTLEQTGMRVSELHHLGWGDCDEQASRFRVKAGKTAAARRWVAVPEWLMAEIAATCPREDRTPDRPVFPGFHPALARDVMRRACTLAGISHHHPHDLRHRYASVQIGNGVPVTAVAAQLGHSKKSMTLDTYSHVLLSEPE